MGWFLFSWRCDADTLRSADGVVVGRGAAGGGARAARGSRPAGSRPGGWVVVADRSGVGADRARTWSAVDRDGDVRAVDGDQAAHRLGIRDADAGGVGLVASATVLSDRDRSAGAGRVQGAQAGAPARAWGGGRDHADGDRDCSARDPVRGAGGADRLHGGGGRHPLSLRRDARAAGRAGAGAREQEIGLDDQVHGAGARPVAVDRQDRPGDIPHAGSSHRAGQGAGDGAQRARRAADRPLSSRSHPAGRHGQSLGARTGRPSQAAAPRGIWRSSSAAASGLRRRSIAGRAA